MAPVDRHERRQQRVRGAGPSSVQASFGFNFGALAARPVKQSSLPPQRSSRRTPVQNTPRGANGSAQRHRSASIQRSSGSKRKSTPKDRTVTPQLGKRKRGSSYAQADADDGEEDELSPDREELIRSIEKSRRVVGTVSPIREEMDDVPDELSILEEGPSTVRKSALKVPAVMNGTPVSVLAQKRKSSGGPPQQTPVPNRVGSMSATSRRSIPRRSRSTDPGAVTPAILTNGGPRPSPASRLEADLHTPRVVPAEEESEDELSPPQVNGTTPHIVAKEQQPLPNILADDELDVDELSSPTHPNTTQGTPPTNGIAEKQDSTGGKPGAQAVVSQPTKRGRPPRVLEDEGDESVTTVAPVKPAQRGRPRKPAEVKETAPKTIPMARKPRERKDTNTNPIVEDEGEEQVDELSPEAERTTQRPGQPSRPNKEIVEISDAGDDSDEYEEPEPEEEPEPTPQPTAKPNSPKHLQRAKASIEKPARKRQKFLGPKHAISVMRIKGSAVRGITVADTTRTILEETIDHRLTRMAEKFQTSQDSTHRKELRSEINLSLSFKESLDEKLLDLQDANDVLNINFKKMKLFKRDNAELRKEILTLQNNRQEVALEHDDIQAEYDAEKARAEERNTLSANMFDIEAAIQNGREKARKEGREDEGPEIPLAMLLETVGKDVGSFGSGGLLSNVESFNSTLERAAAWLEGRA